VSKNICSLRYYDVGMNLATRKYNYRLKKLTKV